jgi:organic hydroperoxide reductase OsmC/OhrA
VEMRGQQKRQFHVRLTQVDGYRFESQASEDGRRHGAPFFSDEPDPVGSASAPATPALLGAAVGHCLSASLLEALRHAHIPVESLDTDVDCVVIPNSEGFPRIDHVDVVIRPALPAMVARAHRCAEIFENHCTVTSSVREGIDVTVRVDWQVHSSGNGAGTQAAARGRPEAAGPAGAVTSSARTS